MPETSIRIDRDVEMVTRDGVTLRADVVRPDISARVPAIVARTPYEKTMQWHMMRGLTPYNAAINGYAFVIQDIRGRYASEGEWNFVDLKHANEDDGFDTIEWVASQDWCDGNIGMAGGSYVAVTQWSAALADPPHLRAIAPALMGISASRSLAHLLPLESMTIGWMAGLAVDRLMKLMPEGKANPADFMTVLEAMTHPEVASAKLPLNDLMVLESIGMPRYGEVDELVTNVAADAGEERFKVPALWSAGWYDNAGGGEMFRTMREKGATDIARSDSRLILGGWTHNYALNFVGSFGLGGLGSADGAGLGILHRTFYDRHLRGANVDLPPVRYFVMGERAWRDADDWPIPGTDFWRMYLHSRGKANSNRGDGALSLDPPAASESPDRYKSDPMDPVPSWGFRVMYTGGTTVAGPFEQMRVEQRDDVLVYTSDPLSEAWEVVGDIDLHLYLSSTARDTDVVAKLCVVWEDGSSFNLADGALRLRRREGPTTQNLIEPGQVYPLKIELGPTGYKLEPGMRLRVQIASTAFPHLARNTQTGGVIEEDTVGEVAENTIFHDAEYPSYVVVPVQPDPGPPAVMTHLLS
ncbi:MAG: CocE/NonD family hydrolase [Actinomycetota bacterium]